MTLTGYIEWPSSLPLPYRDFNGAPANASLSTPEKWVASVRRSRFTKAYESLSVQWNFEDLHELRKFENFFVNVLGNGAAQFIIELKYPKTTELTLWAVQFVGGYQSTSLDGLWQVQAVLLLVNPVEL